MKNVLNICNIVIIKYYLFTILKRKAHAFSHWDESVGFEKYVIKV